MRQVKILEVLGRADNLFRGIAKFFFKSLSSTKNDEKINALALNNKTLLSENNVIISNMMTGFIFFEQNFLMSKDEFADIRRL